VSDLEAFRTMLRDKLAPIRDQLARIEEKLGLLPDLLFLYTRPPLKRSRRVSQDDCQASAAARGSHGAATQVTSGA
jgi:hypothetical protein